MSVRSHFTPNRPSPRMPRCPDGVDPIGIKWHGNVLQGKLSTIEAFALDKIASLTKPQENGASKQDLRSNRFRNSLYGRQW